MTEEQFRAWVAVMRELGVVTAFGITLGEEPVKPVAEERYDLHPLANAAAAAEVARLAAMEAFEAERVARDAVLFAASEGVVSDD